MNPKEIWEYILYKIKKVNIKEIGEYILKKIDQVTDWFKDTYAWISEAFTNWDMELYSFWDQLKQIMRQLGTFYLIAMDKLRYIIKEIKAFIKELLSGFRGWG